MASTNINQFDQVINDEALLLEIGKHFENLSEYKSLTPIPQALIPINHQIYGINIYKDGSISSQSTVAYLLSIENKTHLSDNKCTLLPQKVADPDKWLQEQVVDNTSPIFPEGTQTFSAQLEDSEHPFYQKFSTFTNQLNKLSSISTNLKLKGFNINSPLMSQIVGATSKVSTKSVPKN